MALLSDSVHFFFHYYSGMYVVLHSVTKLMQTHATERTMLTCTRLPFVLYSDNSCVPQTSILLSMLEDYHALEVTLQYDQQKGAMSMA